MSSNAQTKSTLDGLMKEVYGDLQEVVPSFAILQKRIKFNQAQKEGKNYKVGVLLTREAGISYGETATLVGVTTADADDAYLNGSPMTLQAAYSYRIAQAMSESKQAFIDISSLKMQSMVESMAHRVEVEMLYGGSQLATTDSEQDSVCAVTATSQAIIPITAASWAAGIFAGSEGSWVSFFTSADGTTASSAAGNDSSNTVNKFQIAAVDPSAKTITVKTKDGTEAAHLVTEIEGAAYDVRWYGAITNESVGLKSICSNTGTLWNISGASYAQWKGNSINVGADLTLKGILKAAAVACGRGLLGNAVCIVSPLTFAYLSAEQSAYRKYNDGKSIKAAENGVDSLRFFAPNGVVEVLPHACCKNGDAFLFPIEKAQRVGSTDVTFRCPVSGEMILHSATQPVFEVRAYSDQALFLPAPAHCVYMYGITQS